MHRFISDTPTVIITTIEPAECANILADYNPVNRKVNERVVNTYASAMLDDVFRLTGQSIIFSSDGSLADGQHRLEACLASQVPFEAVVAYGMALDTFQFVDQGKTRTVADTLHAWASQELLEGSDYTVEDLRVLHKYSAQLAQFATIVYNYSRGGLSAWSRKLEAQNAQIAGVITDSADPSRVVDSFRFAVGIIGRIRKVKLRAGSIAAMHYMCSELGHQEEFEDYILKVCGVRSTSTHTAAMAVWEWLLRNQAKRDKVGTNGQDLILIVQFHRHLEGKTVKAVKSSPSRGFSDCLPAPSDGLREEWESKLIDRAEALIAATKDPARDSVSEALGVSKHKASTILDALEERGVVSEIGLGLRGGRLILSSNEMEVA